MRGILARIRLEPWGPSIRPHEHTMPGPKADRLGLLRATQTQLSPILVLYTDRSDRYDGLIERPVFEEWRARDGDGLLHRAGVIETDAGLAAYLSRRKLVVADGHHRYETALAYQAEVRLRRRSRGAAPGALAADWVMAVLVNAAQRAARDPAHPSAPAHGGRRPAPGAGRRVPTRCSRPSRSRRRRWATGWPTCGTPRRRSSGWSCPTGKAGWSSATWMRRRTDAARARARRRPGGWTSRSSTRPLLGDRLGITAADVAAGETLLYTRSEADARGRVARGEAAAAILVRPTRLEELTAVAAAGDVMPQKSTYFYPKLLTGMVFYPLEG